MKDTILIMKISLKDTYIDIRIHIHYSYMKGVVYLFFGIRMLVVFRRTEKLFSVETILFLTESVTLMRNAFLSKKCNAI